MIEEERRPDSAMKCQEMCFRTTHCELFTYNVDEKDCLLYKFQALMDWNIKREVGYISGTKVCNYGGWLIVVV